MSILPWIIEHRPEFERSQVEIIDDLLTRKIDPGTAVMRLSYLIDNYKGDLVESSNEDSEIDIDIDFLFFDALLTGARERPSSHPQLVATMVLITQLPDVLDDQGRPVELDGEIFWHDLPDLYSALSFELNRDHIPTKNAPKRRSRVISQLQNSHQFTALLYASGIPAFEGCSDFALWAFREALEGQELENNEKAELWSADIYIPPAAIWIDVAGRRVFECQREIPPDNSSAPFKGGRLWDGKHGFCRGRWDL